jgi:hypothetical protein
MCKGCHGTEHPLLGPGNPPKSSVSSQKAGGFCLNEMRNLLVHEEQPDLPLQFSSTMNYRQLANSRFPRSGSYKETKMQVQQNKG